MTPARETNNDAPTWRLSNNLTEESLAYMEAAASTGRPIPVGWVRDLVATIRRERVPRDAPSDEEIQAVVAAMSWRADETKIEYAERLLVAARTVPTNDAIAALRALIVAAGEEDPEAGWSESFVAAHSEARRVLASYDTPEGAE